jgi:hypothetical protein
MTGQDIGIGPWGQSLLALVADSVRRERRYLNSGVVLDDMKRRGEQKFLERPKA